MTKIKALYGSFLWNLEFLSAVADFERRWRRRMKSEILLPGTTPAGDFS
jgi:hypothetical protein